MIVLPDTSYYHWLLETLPAVLHAFAAEPDATLVAPARLPRFAEEAIELLGFRDVRRIDEPFTAERLVFATRLFRTSRGRHEIVRNTVLPKVTSQARSGSSSHAVWRAGRSPTSASSPSSSSGKGSS